MKHLGLRTASFDLSRQTFSGGGPFTLFPGSYYQVESSFTLTADATPATAGTFTLTFDGETTATIPFDATPSQVAAAVRALPSVITAGATSTSANLGVAAAVVTLLVTKNTPVAASSIDNTGITGNGAVLAAGDPEFRWDAWTGTGIIQGIELAVADTAGGSDEVLSIKVFDFQGNDGLRVRQDGYFTFSGSAGALVVGEPDGYDMLYNDYFTSYRTALTARRADQVSIRGQFDVSETPLRLETESHCVAGMVIQITPSADTDLTGFVHVNYAPFSSGYSRRGRFLAFPDVQSGVAPSM